MNMANQNAAEQETLGSAMNKTELFFENHAKTLSYALLGLIVLAALVFGYRSLVVAPRAEKAADLLAQDQARIETPTPDYALALEGDENGPGFLEVASRYGATPAGNLARHYAGVCYLRTGDLDNAEAFLAKYKRVKGLPGSLVNAQNLGLRGDIAVERGAYAEAVKFYDKAVAAAENDLTCPMYLRKAGLAERALGNRKQAAEYFQRILDRYPASFDAREAEQLLGSVNE